MIEYGPSPRALGSVRDSQANEKRNEISGSALKGNHQLDVFVFFGHSISHFFAEHLQVFANISHYYTPASPV